MSIKAGDIIYGYHPDNNRRGGDVILPRGWKEYLIDSVGRKYYTTHGGIKIDMATMQEANTKYTRIRFVATLDEVKRDYFMASTRVDIANRVGTCRCYETLKAIESLLDLYDKNK